MGKLSELAIVDYHLSLPTKENKLPFPFAANKGKFAISVSRFQQTNGSCRFPLVSFSVYIYIWNKTAANIYKWKPEVYIYIILDSFDD
jgi:hypothetical protein